MNNLSKIFSKENVGMPIKLKIGKNNHNEDAYIYGRYYGRGYDGESNIENDDYHLITLVTPGGSLICGGLCYFEVINDSNEDLEKLNYFEDLEKVPYSPYFKILNDKYYKSYEYEKLPLTFNRYPLKWFEENGYFEIDVDLFGKALSELFTAYFGKRYFYNKILIFYGFYAYFRIIFNKYIGIK